MVVLHYAGISENKSSGVSVIVPEIVNAQSRILTVGLYNYGQSTFALKDEVVYIDNKDNDDYHSFPAPFNKPELVVFHSPFGLKKSIRIAKMLYEEKIPYIIVPHGCFSKYALAKKKFKKWVAMNIVFRSMFNNAAAVQFLSVGEKEASVLQEKAIVVPNGIHMPHNIIRKKNESKINITYIGRKDVYHKGLDLLIEACGIIKDELKELNVEVEIYGPNKEEDTQSVKDLISKNNVGDVVFDYPAVYDAEKSEKFIKSDIIVLLSRFEGLPGVILEAWSFGCPTLLTPGTNMSDEAVENNCGWKTQGDVQEIANTILEICMNRKSIEEKAAQTRTYVEREYAWEIIAEKYKKTYEGVIEKYDSIK